MKNLDAIINEVGFEIVKKINQQEENKTKYKNFIDKALGVLANDGVYAYYVYVVSQKKESENKYIPIFLDTFKEIFNIAKNEVNYDENNRQKYFINVAENIHKLLFLKQLLEKALIYARYHAKAMGD